MLASLLARIRSFCTSALRLSFALAVAFLLTGAVAWLAYWVSTYSEREAVKGAEAPRLWSKDLTSNLGMKAAAKTKMLNGTLLVVVDLEGYPDFIEHTLNRNKGFTFEWNDADGFTHVTKFLPISGFTTKVDDKGKPTGLNAQFSQSASISEYTRLASMQVGWNLETDAAKLRPPAPSAAPQLASGQAPQVGEGESAGDHCAPGLSRQERLRRLAQHGAVRETGYGTYSAGGRTLTMSGGEVIFCS
jgi:hypothetical protein